MVFRFLCGYSPEGSEMTSVMVNIVAKVYPMCSFAILEGPTMPIIGEGEEEPNERYELFTW
jgi:hypothetical protein